MVWPLFGVGNQLLASVALAVGVTILINMGKAKYAWVPLAPLSFLSVMTLYGGFLNIRDNYWPKAIGPDPALNVVGYVDAICTVVMMVCAVVIFGAAARRWLLVLSGKVAPTPDLVEASPAA
jgi:carbon starvation protein